MSTERTPSGRVWHKAGVSRNNMLRPSPNHRTLQLHNEDDDELDFLLL